MQFYTIVGAHSGSTTSNGSTCPVIGDCPKGQMRPSISSLLSVEVVVLSRTLVLLLRMFEVGNESTSPVLNNGGLNAGMSGLSSGNLWKKSDRMVQQRKSVCRRMNSGE